MMTIDQIRQYLSEIPYTSPDYAYLWGYIDGLSDHNYSLARNVVQFNRVDFWHYYSMGKADAKGDNE
jgi:hypothetical protein